MLDKKRPKYTEHTTQCSTNVEHVEMFCNCSEHTTITK